MKTITSVDDLQSFLDKNNIVIIKFYTNFCGPCKEISPYFEKLSKSNPNIATAKCDCEVAEDVCEQLNVSSIPIFIKFVKGKKMGVVQGADKTKLAALFA